VAEVTVLLRGWPGSEGWRPPRPVSTSEPRLWQRNALMIHAAARLDPHGRPVMPETFGLGAALVTIGTAISRGCLFVPDDLAARDPGALARIKAWASDHPLGPAPWQAWQVATVSEFFDPYATAEQEPAAPWAFTPNAYSGAGFVVGADLGRTLALVAEHCGPRRGRATGTWEVWLPGWGRRHDDGRWKRRSPHRPPLRLKERRIGWQVDFGPCENGAGKYVDGHQWRGAFVDLMSLAYSLDAQRGSSFAQHAENFGHAVSDLPLAVAVDETGAERLAEAVRAIHEVAVVLDEHAARWFTTAQDRAEGRGRVDLARTVSPAALAERILAGFGVKPPLHTWRLSDREQLRWAETFHGGWCDDDPRLRARPFGVVAADMNSCYPLVAHHLGWWRMVTAERVHRRGVTAPLVRLCEKAKSDPTVVLDPRVWSRFAATRVEVEADWQRLPVAFVDRRRPDGRMEVEPTLSRGRSLFYAWPDVVAAAILDGHVPRIVRAIRYEPVGHQKIRANLPVLPGLVLDAADDPVIALVGHRHHVKAEGDRLLDGELRLVANALVSGLPSRFDEVWVKPGGKWQPGRPGGGWVRGERPGPRSCFPQAATVTAGARLLLAVLERMVSDLGGMIAYRDTDSSLIPASPDGGKLTLADGSTVRELSWSEVDEILARFDHVALPGWPVWDTKRGSLDAG
jgi:hypothetical protein